jgi:hypothetical protein
MSAISQALRGQESEHTQEAIRVIDIILRQHSAKQYVIVSCNSEGIFYKYCWYYWRFLPCSHSLSLTVSLFACRGCLLVRQSFFHNNPNNFVDLSGGVVGCRGFHSSFRATQSGLSLNIGLLSSICPVLIYTVQWSFLSMQLVMSACINMLCRCVHHNDSETWSCHWFSACQSENWWSKHDWLG